MVIDYFVRTHIDNLDYTSYLYDPLLFEMGCFTLRSRNVGWHFYVAGFDYPGIFTNSKHIISEYAVLTICRI